MQNAGNMHFHFVLLALALCLCADSRLIKIHSSHDELEIDIEDEPVKCLKGKKAPGRDGDVVREPAKPCDRSKCKLPDCRCVGTDIPGGLAPADTPQMVILTFGQAIRPQDISHIQALLHGRKNPNGCPISATFFPVAQGSYYYSGINLFHSLGHEIALGGVSTGDINWPVAPKEQWQKMMQNEVEMLTQFAGIAKDEMKGWRTPRLAMGGDRMFSALNASGLRYDATRVADRVADKPNLFWPFTYDYSTKEQTCTIPPCPEQSWPGIWELPIVAQKGPDGGRCADLAGCNVTTADQAYTMLMEGFQERHGHSGNRSPILLSMSLPWILNHQAMNGTNRFLDAVLSNKDVFVVSAARALSWIRHPKRVQDKPNAFDCKTPPPGRCPHNLECLYDANFKHTDRHEGAVYTTDMCARACPPCYPAFDDPLGQNYCLK